MLTAASCTTYGGGGAASGYRAYPTYYGGYVDRDHYYRGRHYRHEERGVYRSVAPHRSQRDRDHDRGRYFRDREDDRRQVRFRGRDDADRDRSHRRYEHDNRDRRHAKRERRDGETHYRHPPQDDERGWFGNAVRRRPSQDGG